MAVLLDLKAEPAVKPKMPGAINVPTQSVANPQQAAPAIPGTAPPNVDGGKAEFSSETDGIMGLLNAKKAELAGSIDAYKANLQVDVTAARTLSSITDETLNAFHKIQKAEALPGGSSGGLAKIISLFDSDYNVPLQTLKVQENQIRANQVTQTANTLKAQNDALPALMAKVTEAQQAMWTAQKDANQLAINQGHLKQAELNTQMGFIRLGIEQNKEARDAEEHPWKMKQAQLSVANAQLAFQKGQREEGEAQLEKAMSNLTVDVLQQRLNVAQQTGSPFVQFPTGKVGKDGKPEMLNVPIPVVQKGMVANAKLEEAANAALAADYNNKMKIIPTAQGLITGMNGMASVDPRAAQVVTATGQILSALDPKNPSNVRQIGMLLKEQEAVAKTIADESSKKFSTPEAQAAFKSFAVNGKFDPIGGTAVIQDSVGIPSLTTQTMYRSAFTYLNTQLASQLKRNDMDTFGGASTSDTATDAMGIMAQLLQQKGGKQKLKELTAQILVDPAAQKEVRRKIGGVIQSNAFNGVLLQLSEQDKANPVWKDMYENSGQFVDKGAFSPQKLFEKLEQQTVVTGGKVNYSEAFLGGLRNFAVNADNTPQTSAAYTVYDHALEASIFGDRPHTAALGDLHYNLRIQAQRAHAAMQERIKQDISGATQLQALRQSAIAQQGGLEMLPAFSPQNYTQIYKKTGIDPAAVPSATGTSLTAEQVKKLYGGGN
jgi:hypothetical protein